MTNSVSFLLPQFKFRNWKAKRCEYLGRTVQLSEANIQIFLMNKLLVELQFLWILKKSQLQFCILFICTKSIEIQEMNGHATNYGWCRRQTCRIWVSCFAAWLIALKTSRQSKAGIPAGRWDSGPLNRKLLISAVDRLLSSSLWSRTTARTGFFRRPCKIQNTFTGLQNITYSCCDKPRFEMFPDWNLRFIHFIILFHLVFHPNRIKTCSSTT